jgi:hypothetical protein
MDEYMRAVLHPLLGNDVYIAVKGEDLKKSYDIKFHSKCKLWSMVREGTRDTRFATVGGFCNYKNYLVTEGLRFNAMFDATAPNEQRK